MRDTVADPGLNTVHPHLALQGLPTPECRRLTRREGLRTLIAPSAEAPARASTVPELPGASRLFDLPGFKGLEAETGTGLKEEVGADERRAGDRAIGVSHRRRGGARYNGAP